MALRLERISPPQSSMSSIIVKILQDLQEGNCVTLLPETAHENDLNRQRIKWSNAAKRARIDVITRAVTTEHGERAIRIWRTDYP